MPVCDSALHLQLLRLSGLVELCPVAAPQSAACLQAALTHRASRAGLLDKLKTFASKRKMEDGTLGPVITWTTDGMLGHVDKLTKISGGCGSAFRTVHPALQQFFDELPGCCRHD